MPTSSSKTFVRIIFKNQMKGKNCNKRQFSVLNLLQNFSFMYFLVNYKSFF